MGIIVGLQVRNAGNKYFELENQLKMSKYRQMRERSQVYSI